MKKIKMISLMVALILVLTVVPISASAANTNYTMDDISSKQIFAKKLLGKKWIPNSHYKCKKETLKNLMKIKSTL